MDTEERKYHAHLGDGVYAQFDGYGFWLRANHHSDEHCTDKIYIEPSVLKNLNEYYAHLLKQEKPSE